ncbi:MAG: Kiwa anti-phage protein KwaB-like domain-containing protein [Thermoleophilaceae bacterium]
MTAKTALEELRDFFEDEPDLEAATVARGKGGSAVPEVRVLNLAGDAQEFFRAVVKSAVVDKIGRWSLKKLDPLYKPDPDEVEWERTADIEAVELAVDRYRNLSPLAQFDAGDDAYKKRLLYWVVVLSHTDGRQAFFFRSFTASAELERKRGAALVAREGTFRRVEERIFLFEDTIDCFVFDDFLYVVRKRDYRRIFDQLDQIRRRAKRAARALHRQVPIANVDEFADACSTDSRMADKVLAVQNRDYFNTLSYDRLKKVIEEFSLQIPTEKRNGKVHLVFRTEPNQRFRILKLVDDDYLRSSWTDHRYEVNSKTDPPG